MGMMDVFNEGSEALCQQILKLADGKTEVAMLEQLNNVTLDVIAKVLYRRQEKEILRYFDHEQILVMYYKFSMNMCFQYIILIKYFLRYYFPFLHPYFSINRQFMRDLLGISQKLFSK